MLECGQRKVAISSGQQIFGLQVVRMQLDPVTQIAGGGFEILTVIIVKAALTPVGALG